MQSVKGQLMPKTESTDSKQLILNRRTKKHNYYNRSSIVRVVGLFIEVSVRRGQCHIFSIFNKKIYSKFSKQTSVPFCHLHFCIWIFSWYFWSLWPCLCINCCNQFSFGYCFWGFSIQPLGIVVSQRPNSKSTGLPVLLLTLEGLSSIISHPQLPSQLYFLHFTNTQH